MAEDDTLYEFCGGDPFWNSSLTWNTDNPDFTDCFQKTAFVWFSCGILWLLSPIEIYYLMESKHRHIPTSRLNMSKMILVGLLFILSISDMGYDIGLYKTIDETTGARSAPAADYVASLILALTFCISFTFMIMERIRGLRTSGVQFCFYFVLAVTGAFNIRSFFMKVENNAITDSTPFAIFSIYYPIVLAVLLLHCFGDAEPKKHIITYRPKKMCPEEESSFLSWVTFSWFDKLAIHGYKNPLEFNDLWDLNFEETSQCTIAQFEKHWNKIKAKRPNAKSPTKEGKPKENPNIVKALFLAFGLPFAVGAFLRACNDVLIFLSPIFLNKLITYVDDKTIPQWHGYFFATMLFISSELQSLFLGQYFNYMFLVGMRVRTACISAVYKKALVLSNSAKKSSTVGEIVNLMAVDAQRFLDLLPYVNLAWSVPFQVILGMILLWNVVGVSSLTGLAIMVLLVPINAVVAAITKKLQMKQMEHKDHRVKLMNEILSGMKVLKLYAWEPSFKEQIDNIRENELKVLKGIANLNAATSFIWTCAPFLVSLGTFATYVMIDDCNVLTPNKAFVALAIFNLLRSPLSFIPNLIVYIIQSAVSVSRLNEFLGLEELDPNTASHDENARYPLIMENATFAWGPNDPPVLKNMNLHVKKGSLVAVVGPVGAGKSSFISALLGEMDRFEGKLNTTGRVAYAAQQAWIQNATLRDNILFGKPYIKEKYDKVIEACALTQDLEILTGGDQTEIGEKGINLSGGQKQRVSLARTVYSDFDVFLLDDPLSAVDSHVGKHIFDKVIGPKGVLSGKTRVLVTHGVTYLPQADLIVVLDNGVISESGTYRELLDKKGAFADFLVTYLDSEDGLDEIEVGDIQELKSELVSKIGQEEIERRRSRQKKSSESDANSIASGTMSRNASLRRSQARRASAAAEKALLKASSVAKTAGDDEKKGTTLISAEVIEKGKVNSSIYSSYVIAGGILITVLTVVFNTINQAFSILSNWWLSEWAKDPTVNITNSSGYVIHESCQDEDERAMSLGIYGVFGVLQTIFVLAGSVTLAIATVKASRVLHSRMLENVMKSPMSFFDTTPIGRIVNRFSKDVDVVDNVLPFTLRYWIVCLFQVVATIVVICAVTPWFTILLIPIGIIYYFVQVMYIATSRQLKRIESVSRSPIYTHFSETITGAPTIRTYKKEEEFIAESERRVDINQISFYPSTIAARWLGIRLEIIGNLTVFAAALLAVVGREEMDPGLVGLSISYSLSITVSLNWLVRMSGDLETNIVAVERLKEYSVTPVEPDWIVPGNRTRKTWPEEGCVTFKDYATRYREGLELVLRGISCEIKSGEKIGIVGRTGAGKSSLTLSLFRLIEGASGSIIIDGVEISKIGLHDLKAGLTIIPQDPVLFSGSLRINLDPFNKHSDEDIWKALELSHLKSFAASLADGLNYEISEGGENLSVGQRQLVCLARALLRKTKILVLDEATAAVDLETDDLIQATIRKEFAECTVLTIAHRLNTIMDSTRVMVLDQGLIKEFDSPPALLADHNSIFYGMAKDANLVQ